MRVIGLAVDVVLARLLAPDDFGQLALGLTLYTAVSVFANAGLGAALDPAPGDTDARGSLDGIRSAAHPLRRRPCTRRRAGAVVRHDPLTLAALYLLALPIQALRTPALIQWERRLDYRRMALVAAIDALGQAVFAVSLRVAGSRHLRCGAGSRPGGPRRHRSPARVAAGPADPTPAHQITSARSSLGWSAVGASDATNLAQHLALNWGTAAIAGTSVLGAWAMTVRLALVLSTVVESLGRVTYSAVPRLHAAGGSSQSFVVPALRLTAAGLGAPAALLAGCAPIWSPSLSGPDGRASATCAPDLLGLLIGGPVAVASAGRVFADVVRGRECPDSSDDRGREPRLRAAARHGHHGARSIGVRRRGDRCRGPRHSHAQRPRGRLLPLRRAAAGRSVAIGGSGFMFARSLDLHGPHSCWWPRGSLPLTRWQSHFLRERMRAAYDGSSTRPLRA